jgi:polar amino acid transport system permease protein
MSYEFDFRVVLAQYPDILRGAWVTLALTCLSLALGFLLSIVVAYGRTSRLAVLRVASTAYVEIFRNTPMLVQLFFFYFGLAALGLRMTPVAGAVLVLTLNVGAYATEIVRAGLEATPRGHIEAGLSLGMGRLQIFRYVMLKPALQRIYPALTGQFIMVMLGTSVVSQIGADELTSVGNFIQSRSFRSLEVFLVIGAIYLLLAVGLRKAFDLIGARYVTNR